jgi:hypothetical protein
MPYQTASSVAAGGVPPGATVSNKAPSGGEPVLRSGGATFADIPTAQRAHPTGLYRPNFSRM